MTEKVILSTDMKGVDSTILDMRHRLVGAALSALLLISSCESDVYIPSGPIPDTGPAMLEVTPWAVEIEDTGDTYVVFVKVMDRNRTPIPNQPVSARVENPAVARIEERETQLTDDKGLAKFTLIGEGMPDATKMIFTAGAISTKIDVWKRGYGPYGW